MVYNVLSYNVILIIYSATDFLHLIEYYGNTDRYYIPSNRKQNFPNSKIQFLISLLLVIMTYICSEPGMHNCLSKFINNR